MSVADFYFNTEYEIDKIIATYSGTIASSAPTSGGGSTTASASHTHGFGDSTYYQGVFSVDGGTTWNDFGADIPYTGGTYLAIQTVEVDAVVTTTAATVTVTNFYDYANSRGVAYTVQYKLYLMAKNTMASPITPSNQVENTNFDTRLNYQKVAFSGSTTLNVSAGSTGSTSVAHNLGYVPNVRAFWFDSGSSTTCRSIRNYAQVKIGTSNVTFYTDQGGFSGFGVNGTIQYRIYYDA